MIRELSKAYSIGQLCQVLEVVPSGYYRWRQGRVTKRQRANAGLVEEIKSIHKAKRET